MKPEYIEYDVIILGAGMVGLVTANLCAQQNLSVALVDPYMPARWDPNKIDMRCSAISRRSQNILQSLGAWEKIANGRVSPYQRMEVWDACSEGEIFFDAKEIAEADLGHIVENSLVIQSLWELALEKEKNEQRDQRKQKEQNEQKEEKEQEDPIEQTVHRYIPAKPLAFSKQPDHIQLQLEDGRKLTAQLLVGADGAQSWLRKEAQIKTRGWDYQQQALVATVWTSDPHLATARQCFLKDGVLAMLPLNDAHACTIVWSSSPEKISALLTLDEKQFCEELTHAFDYRLGAVLKASERRAFPLAMQHAVQYIDERIALVGDAAHVIHPLAGQGVNLGFYDAETLVDVLKEAKQKQYDLGQRLLLRRYERARKGHNIAMISSMEFFKRAFGSRISLLQGVRGFGMNKINASKSLKRKIIHHAMGILN